MPQSHNTDQLTVQWVRGKEQYPEDNKIVRHLILYHIKERVTKRKDSSLKWYDTKHDRACKLVTEIKDHAKNFPNTPRTVIDNCLFKSKIEEFADVICLVVCIKVCVHDKRLGWQNLASFDNKTIVHLREFSCNNLARVFMISNRTDRGSEFLPLRVVSYGMETHFYHVRWPPLNVTIFITHVRNCEMGATPMFIHIVSQVVLFTKWNWIICIQIGVLWVNNTYLTYNAPTLQPLFFKYPSLVASIRLNESDMLL